jgi:heme-degrading monooxygenase HmoA
MSRKIIRVSERFVSPMMEIRVKEIMEKVEKDIRGTKGLERIETLVDRNNPDRHMVVTEWSSRHHLNMWLKSDLCKKTIIELEQVLDKNVKYREYTIHEDDVFLL